MKILQLLSHGSIGGTETFILSLVRGLIERGHDVTLVNTWTDSVVNDLARASGVPITTLRGGRRRLGPRWVWVVGRYLRKNRFDIVHTYGLRASLAIRIMQKRLGIGHHVFACRGLEQLRSGLQYRLDRATERRLDCIVCNARAVADKRMSAVGTPPALIRVIPNGIDLSRFSPDVAPADGNSFNKVDAPRELKFAARGSLGLPAGFLFVHVGSFRVEKDHETLFEAVRSGGDRWGDARVLLVGGGQRRAIVEEQVRSMGLTDRVVFVGPAEDVRPYLRASDAFVLSSSSEGMPRALMEAMAMGLPCVSTTAGGVAEVAENDKHALLVPTRSPAALADAMLRLMRDAALRDRLGRAAALRIRDEFSHDVMIDRHVGLYRSLLDGSLHAGDRSV